MAALHPSNRGSQTPTWIDYINIHGLPGSPAERGETPLVRSKEASNEAEDSQDSCIARPRVACADAEVMVLEGHAYETAVKGKNGFVCMVERSWTAGIEDPDFWNPKLRAPICFNPPAARSYLPLTIRKTESVLAARSKTQMFEAIKTALDKSELPAVEPGAMCYMMSKQGYLGDSAGHWHPHLMFFVPLTEPAVWGAGLPGSPLIGSKDPEDRLTVYLLPIAKWSDGTADSVHEH